MSQKKSDNKESQPPRCSFDVDVPSWLDVVPSNKKSLDEICPLNKKEAMLKVINIEGEEIGGSFTGLPLYTGRCMGALEGGGKHIFVVDKKIKHDIQENINYLQEIKLIGKEDVEILDIDMTGEPYTFKALLRELKREMKQGETRIADTLNRVSVILPFICSKDLDDFISGIKKLGFDHISYPASSACTEKVNNKGITITKKLKEKHIPVPDGVICYSEEGVLNAYDKLLKKYDRLLVKKARSASGIGLEFIKSKKHLQKVLNKQFEKKDYKKGVIVEERLRNIVSAPGIVMNVRKGKKRGEPNVTLLGLSEQCFFGEKEGNKDDVHIHLGNIWPIDKRYWTNQIWDVVKAYTRWVDEAGAYGVCGLDLAICKKGKSLRAYPLDPNCRITGSLHPLLILHNVFGSSRLDNIAWISDNNFAIPKAMSLTEFVAFLRKNKLEFINEEGEREGIIVANHAPCVHGKTQIIIVKKVDPCAKTREKQQEVRELWERAKQLMQAHINKEKALVHLTKRLVLFESVHEKHEIMDEAFYYCMKRLDKRGVFLREFSSNFHRSLVATYRKTMDPKIMLVGHIDVVPGEKEDFECYEQQGRLYGRGSGDMKSAVAVMMELFLDFLRRKEKPSVGLMLTTDEEIGGQHGTRYLLEKRGYGCDVAVIPDSNSGLSDIIVQQKGALHLKVNAKGKTAHASRPAEGINAIENLFDIYKDLRRVIPKAKEVHFGTTMTLDKINGGDQINQVPDYAEMYLDIRYPKADKFKKNFEEIRKITKSNFDIEFQSEPFIIKKTNTWIKRYARIADRYIDSDITYAKEFGASDAAHFSRKNIPAIITGLQKGNTHSEHEWVRIKDLKNFYDIVREFIITYGY